MIREINLIYFFNLISSFATSMITLFVPIYLYQNNYSIIQILLFFFISYLTFTILAYPIGKIVGKIGKKKSILVSIPFMIAYLLLLRGIPEAPLMFFFAAIVIAMRHAFFNFGYHLEFLEGSNKEKRSSEMSFNEIILVFTRAIGPIVGGIISFQYGFNILFIISAVLSLLAVLPLFLTRDNSEATELRGIFNSILHKKKHRPLIRSYAGYAIETSINRDIWPIYLIIILGTTQAVGGMAGITMLISIIVLFFIGKVSDINKKKVLKYGSFFYPLSWIFRLFANHNIIYPIETYRNITQKIISIPWGSYSYEMFSHHNYFGHIVEREILFNLSRIIITPLLMLVFLFNWYPFTLSILIAFLFSTQYFAITKYDTSV